MQDLYELQGLLTLGTWAVVLIGWGLYWLWKVFLKALRNEGRWDDADHGEGEED